MVCVIFRSKKKHLTHTHRFTCVYKHMYNGGMKIKTNKHVLPSIYMVCLYYMYILETK